ncbi:MAG TPA: hypothetical protein VGP38_08245 [Rubrobacter sp.]|nr:hypothetical protein [Rubrobacter sp.]
MGYVDLRKRTERRRGTRDPAERQHHTRRNPCLLAALGFAFGVLASLLASSVFHVAAEGLAPLATLLLLIAALTVLCYADWSLLRRSPENDGPKFGGEKQLLLAILDAGGTITPVEAALATSLTVDEAEEILTRFADRGHLLVESRDGALSYALPGKREAGLDGG